MFDALVFVYAPIGCVIGFSVAAIVMAVAAKIDKRKRGL